MDRQQAINSIRALESWAKKVTTGYQDVEVRDMSSSFRDGLAFCAIIHHFRPDLLNFESLSKENILQNNSLAFSVAEKQLGVPALLDAEDMVKYSRPDRLSIITYLSQLHNCFENQNKVNTMKAAVKRIPSNNIVGPPSKVAVVKPASITLTRHEVCTVCSHRVFILERLIVDGKLYHRTCFRCSKCKCLLNPGTYIESDTPGVYECSVCPIDDHSDASEMEDSRSISSLDDKLDDSPKPVLRSLPSPSPSTVRVTSARNSFLKQSLSPSGDNKNIVSPIHQNKPAKTVSYSDFKFNEKRISVKDKISAFETSQESVPILKQESASTPDSILAPVKNEVAISSDSVPKPTEHQSVLSKDIKSETVIASLHNSEQPSIQNSQTVDTNNSGSKESPNSSPAPTGLKSPISALSDMKVFPKLDSPVEQGKSTLANENLRNQTGDYKSPIKVSRDIFKTNFSPLKLSIPNVNKTNSNISSLKFGDNKPQVSSTYTKNLLRPTSYENLSSNEEPTNSLSDILHSKEDKVVPRKSSLDSSTKEIIKNSNDSDTKGLHGVSKIESCDDRTDSANHVTSPKTLFPIPSIRQSLLLNKTSNSISKLNIETADQLPVISKIDKPTQPKADESGTSAIEDLADLPKSPSAASLESAVPKTTLTKPDELYPGDLNPFGDEEEEYPDDLNPFGDDDETSNKTTNITTSSAALSLNKSQTKYDESMNPFASDDEDDVSQTSLKTQASPMTKIPISSTPTKVSPTGSLRGTLKKRLAPKPPKIGDIFPNDSQDSDISLTSLKSSPSAIHKSFRATSPKLRKSKPPPPPPPVVTPNKENTSHEIKSTTASATTENDTSQHTKKKKRPAPPVPIPKRLENKKIPLKEILKEMKEIEGKQRECEQQGREIEILIRDKDKDEEASVEEEEYIMQLFELVNQKNALFRRQAELMYIKRSQRLEEQQDELQKQIRDLFSKPDSDKTDEDRLKEEELIMELKDVVDQRSSIIDSIEMDRRRELEEDVSIQEQTELKNGELPIAAEMKEKSSAKKEKKEKKKKKDKKKNKEENDKKKEKKTDKEDTEKKKEKKKWFPKVKVAE